jgi:hypothetical protein
MVDTEKGANRRHCYRLNLPIAAATLVLAVGLAARAAPAAEFWLQGRYTAATVKRVCDAHDGQFHMYGGLRYRCELADGRAVECTQNNECRAHVASSSALPRRTLQSFLADAASAPKGGH